MNHLEVCTIMQARTIASKDAPVCTSKTPHGKYVESNTVGYYVICNTWLILFQEFAGPYYKVVLDSMLNHGLVKIIAQMDSYALRLIRSEDVKEVNPLRLEVRKALRSYISYSDEDLDEMSVLLMLLRYPKRFSPNCADKLQSDSVEAYRVNENRTKLLQRHSGWSYTRYMYVVRWARDVITELYPWDRLCDFIQADLYPGLSVPYSVASWLDSQGYVGGFRSSLQSGLTFSSGACSDARPTLAGKLLRMYTDGRLPAGFGSIMGYNILGSAPLSDILFSENLAHINPVPKSYKAARIIAMEQCYRNEGGARVERYFRTYDRMYRRVDLTDQTINQSLAKAGSSGGGYATLDASNASDLIGRSLLNDLFPPRFAALISPLLTTHLLYPDGKVQPMQMLSSSGHTLTFRLETLVYLAIAQAASNFYSVFSGEELLPAWAYGDDVLIDQRAAEVAIDFYEVMGLKINPEKSYWSGSYRESCGKEYLDGKEIFSLYFPRFPVKGTFNKGTFTVDDEFTIVDDYRGKITNSLVTLIDLQKRLMRYSYNSGTFLYYFLKDAYPRMTSSAIGDDCEDLWAPLPDYEVRPMPKCGKFEGTGKDRILKNLPFSKAVDGKISQRLLERINLDYSHMVPRVTHKSRKQPEEELILHLLYDSYKYYEFLRSGPNYEDDLSAILGVTAKPLTYEGFLGRLSLEMKRVF